MSTSVGDLFRQALELDEHDRATLAGLLLESLEYEVNEDVDGTWQEEIGRRLARTRYGQRATCAVGRSKGGTHEAYWCQTL